MHSWHSGKILLHDCREVYFLVLFLAISHAFQQTQLVVCMSEKLGKDHFLVTTLAPALKSGGIREE